MIVTVEIFGIHAVVSVVPQLAAVANSGETLLFGAAAARQQQALGIPGRPGDDVDHSIDRVGAPERRARATDHFDPLDIFQQRVLHVPVHAGEQRRIDAAPIHQDQKFVGEQIVETPRADGPAMGVHARHLHAGNQAQGLGNARRARATKLVRGNDGNGSRRYG